MVAPAVAVRVAGEAWNQRHRLGPALLVAFSALVALLVAVASLTGPSPMPASGGAGSKVIPPQYLVLYLQASTQCPGLRPTLLEAVGSIESGHGANMGPSSAGALGPMQFMPATFAGYAPGQPPEAIMDPAVAIPAAARLLCADGVAQDDMKALALYGASVTAPAAGAAYATLVANEERNIITGGTALIGAPGITLSPAAGFDAASSGLSPRLVALLLKLGASTPLTIGTLRSGHTVDVTGPNGEDTGRPSNHGPGRAADITTVGGQPVSASNLAAHELVAGLAALQPPERPSEVGSPFTDLAPSPRWFFHSDHIHIGYDQ
jgi:hypothetical protein